MSDDFSDDGGEDESEERMRDMLAQYYGIAGGAGGVSTAGAVAGPATTRGRVSAADAAFRMDAVEFDSSEYVRHLLRTCETADLLQRNDEMVHEIKALDSDMQMLVYENYNKFISATDTIRSMKENVESMEEEMDTLVASMDEIADKSERINSSLASKRSQIDKLVRVRRLLKRLEFFFELPQRLQQCIDEGLFAQAVKYFKIARETLREYSHVASFSNIQAESEQLMDALRTRLKTQIQDTDQPSQMNDLVRLLLDLDVPAEDLRPQLLHCHEQCFTQILRDEARKVSEEGPSADLGIQSLNEAFVSPFAAAVASFRKIFPCPEGVVLEDFEEDLSAVTNTVFDLYFELATSMLASPGGPDVHQLPNPARVRHLATALESLLGATRALDVHLPTCKCRARGADFVEKFLSNQLAIGFQWVRQETLAALRALAGAQEAEPAPNSALESEHGQTVPADKEFKELDLPTTAAASLHTVDQRSFEAEDWRQKPTTLKAVLEFVLERFGRMLDSTQPLVQFGDLVLGESRRTAGQQTFAARTAGDSRTFVVWLATCMEILADVTLRPGPQCVWGLEHSASTSPTAAFDHHAEESWEASVFLQGVTAALGEPQVVALVAPTPRFALECSVLCRGLHRNFTPALADVIEGSIPASRTEARVDDDEVQTHTRSSSNRLLGYFVELHGNEIAAQIRAAVRSLFNAQGPVDAVSPAVCEACEGFIRALREVAAVLELRPVASAMSRTNTWRPIRQTSGLSSAHKGLQLDIERVFSERVQVFGEVRFNLASILEGLAKIVLKAMCEQIRVVWLTPDAYQQLLVDTQFVRLVSHCFVENVALLDGLVDEALVAAAERLVEPLAERSTDNRDLRAAVSTACDAFEVSMSRMGVELR